MKEKLTNEEKKFLESEGFTAHYPDEKDLNYVQYIKYFKHPLIIDLHIVVDGTINVWGKEHKLGLHKSHYLITHKKFTKFNLLILIEALTKA